MGTLSSALAPRRLRNTQLVRDDFEFQIVSVAIFAHDFLELLWLSFSIIQVEFLELIKWSNRSCQSRCRLLSLEWFRNWACISCHHIVWSSNSKPTTLTLWRQELHLQVAFKVEQNFKLNRKWLQLWELFLVVELYAMNLRSETHRYDRRVNFLNAAGNSPTKVTVPLFL